MLAQDKQAIRYSLDLNTLRSDEVDVTVTLPKGAIKQREITFYFARTVPGAYEFYDFGRFVKSVKATCVRGTNLTVTRTEANAWVISDADILAKVEYVLEDTWDTGIEEKRVFEPAGSNFEADRNFLLNEGACFGYFKGLEKMPIELVVDRPVDFLGSTALTRVGGDMDTDIFRADNFHHFVDCPIMFCRPDTSVIRLGLTKVVISVYSPNKTVTSKFIAKEIRPILEAQLRYMNNILPVDRYTFIFYFSDKDYPTQSIGALEHSLCSIFTLYETKPDRLVKTLRDFIAHEFFHIVTPLYIHSEEIQNFDYNKPKMSEHLWLYEGVVEYLAQHVLIEAKIYSLEEFLKVMRRKLNNSDDYRNDIPFTMVSRSCLDPEFADQYYNVYEKGAVIAMCLDLLLIKQSDGNYNLRTLLRDLARSYGQNKPFKDTDLFGKIEELTYPAVGDFLRNCVGGTRAMPIKALMESIGINYIEDGTSEEISPLGGIDNGVLKTDDNGRFFIGNVENLDEFGKINLGLKANDILVSWNGENLSKESASKVIYQYLENVKEGDDLEVVVLRKDANKNEKQLKLRAKVSKIKVKDRHLFLVRENLSPLEQKLQKFWMD